MGTGKKDVVLKTKIQLVATPTDAKSTVKTDKKEYKTGEDIEVSIDLKDTNGATVITENGKYASTITVGTTTHNLSIQFKDGKATVVVPARDVTDNTKVTVAIPKLGSNFKITDKDEIVVKADTFSKLEIKDLTKTGFKLFATDGINNLEVENQLVNVKVVDSKGNDVKVIGADYQGNMTKSIDKTGLVVGFANELQAEETYTVTVTIGDVVATQTKTMPKAAEKTPAAAALAAVEELEAAASNNLLVSENLTAAKDAKIDADLAVANLPVGSSFSTGLEGRITDVQDKAIAHADILEGLVNTADAAVKDAIEDTSKADAAKTALEAITTAIANSGSAENANQATKDAATSYVDSQKVAVKGKMIEAFKVNLKADQENAEKGKLTFNAPWIDNVNTSDKAAQVTANAVFNPDTGSAPTGIALAFSTEHYTLSTVGDNDTLARTAEIKVFAKDTLAVYFGITAEDAVVLKGDIPASMAAGVIELSYPVEVTP